MSYLVICILDNNYLINLIIIKLIIKFLIADEYNFSYIGLIQFTNSGFDSWVGRVWII